MRFRAARAYEIRSIGSYSSSWLYQACQSYFGNSNGISVFRFLLQALKFDSDGPLLEFTWFIGYLFIRNRISWNIDFFNIWRQIEFHGFLVRSPSSILVCPPWLWFRFALTTPFGVLAIKPWSRLKPWARLIHWGGPRPRPKVFIGEFRFYSFLRHILPIKFNLRFHFPLFRL